MICGGKTISEWGKCADAGEIRAYMLYGGKRHIAFHNGHIVKRHVYGCAIPDIVRVIDNRIEAIEVKSINLIDEYGYKKYFHRIKYQIAKNVDMMPAGSLQRVVIDLRDIDYDNDFLQAIRNEIKTLCWDIYKNLPVDFI